MKTKTLISIVTVGLLGTLADVNGDDIPLVPASDVVMAPQIPMAPTAVSSPSSPSAPAPPTGLRVVATPAATLAAIPTDSPGGYYTNGEIRGYYINVNSPYWATNQSYGDLVYRHTTNSFSISANSPKTETNPHEISKSVTAAR